MAAAGFVRYDHRSRRLAERSEGNIMPWAVPAAIITMVAMCVACIVIHGVRHPEEFDDRSRLGAGFAALANVLWRIRDRLQSLFSHRVNGEVVRTAPAASECELKWKDLTLNILRTWKTYKEGPREVWEPCRLEAEDVATQIVVREASGLVAWHASGSYLTKIKRCQLTEHIRTALPMPKCELLVVVDDDDQPIEPGVRIQDIMRLGESMELKLKNNKHPRVEAAKDEAAAFDSICVVPRSETPMTM
eukprot:TRINITY_DN44010_c0_g1_i1.p1 TRINITY_DN44010_c0_g1~~TRINITY_DN44010_c0_g1_i1.p1  ORF type:complete len:261 (-),score=39.54 TRINITY_DN44010_c0_g1_i1:119-859(-)